ncbi:MAG: hypothetical protein ACRET5_07955 [Steroidobacteraceae bacterium]
MKRTTLTGMIAVAALLACVPLTPAYAYIDPNSAGAIYQILFPLIIAIGSVFAFLRRTIVRACTRFASAVVAVVRGDRGKGEEERRRPGGHAE